MCERTCRYISFSLSHLPLLSRRGAVAFVVLFPFIQLILTRCFVDALDLLLRLVPASLLSARNGVGSTPLHWATLNTHLDIVKKLVLHPQGLGKDLIDIKNDAGRSPLGEAENVGWDEGAAWLVQMMNLDDGQGEELAAGEEDIDANNVVEVEIQDAEGRVAKMKLGPRSAEPAASSTAIKEGDR